MEVDIRIRAKDPSILIFHPNVKKLCKNRPFKTTPKKGSLANKDHGSREGVDISSSGSHARKQNLGTVGLGESEGQLDTAKAIKRRNERELPALLAAFTVEVSNINRQRRRYGDGGSVYAVTPGDVSPALVLA